ncbi:MAG: group III truncated hemoglobin [Reichenbachiella sp.]
MTEIQTRDDIKTMIDAFYHKAVNDDVIGFFFTEVIQLDFEIHMPKMYDFWETTLFHKAVYKGNPMSVHQDLHQKSPLEKVHYDRWQTLFLETVDELFEGEKAELAKQRAQSIAMMMQIKIK